MVHKWAIETMQVIKELIRLAEEMNEAPVRGGGPAPQRGRDGYPPDKQGKATQTVLEQAEVLCKDWAD